MRGAPLFFALFACAHAPPLAPQAPIDAGLEKAARFMIGKQSPDGAFRSEHYSALADGRALTPIALNLFYFMHRLPGLDAAYARGSDFVATLANADGTLNAGEYGLEYPVYSLSLGVLVLNNPSNARHDAAKQTLIRHLQLRQLDEANGWSEADIAHGGWGYYHDLPKRPAVPNELLTSNLTSTLFAAGALQVGGVGLEDPLFAKARRFVEKCQNYADPPRGPFDDGGFIHTPTDEVPNKAGGEDGHFRSYGTTTADGIRALLRLGVSRDEPRAKAAIEWLFAHFDVEKVPGEYPPDREVFRASGYYYWAWTLAHALMQIGPKALEDPRTKDWPATLANALLSRQKADGSWQNSASDLREDDPLVATSLAGAALAICKVMLGDRFDAAVHN